MTTGNNIEKGGNIWVAVSIVIAGILVAGAVIFTSKDQPKLDVPNTNTDGGQAEVVEIPEITAEDHIKGNPNAPIKIVEYSDTECPFCKRLHVTLHELLDQYPDDVAWVYRHLPIVNNHPKALPEAIATECAAELGGNDIFWAYIDRIYNETPGNNRLNLDLLPQFATELGLDLNAFNECTASGKYNDKIAQQVKDGFAAGAQGTPFSIVITPDGNKIPVSGAQPINVWQQIIESVLAAEGDGSGE